MDNYKINYYKNLLGDMKTSERILNNREIDELYNLFDEEIARQLVGSEEVAEAIDWATEELNDSIRYQHNYKARCLDTIITALHQYQFPSAIQWTGKNLREVIDLVGLNPSASKWTWTEYEQVVAEKGLKIFTPDGSVMVDVGDWIIQNGKDCYVTRQTGYKSRTRADKQVVARRSQWSDVEQEAYHEWLNTPDHGQD